MKHFLALLLALLPVGAQAQPVTSPAPVAGSGAYNSAPPTCTAGQFCYLQTDAAGNLKTVSSASPTGTQNVQGNTAAGAADSGFPVKIGGIYTVTLPTLADGQRGNTQLAPNGAMLVSPAASVAAADAIANTNGASTFASNGTARYPLIFNMNFNGTSWDREFTCPSSAVVNVTAGATTEIVPLTASQTIRVCSFAITASAAGTATFIYGTGAACATSPVNLTGAFALGTTVPLAISAGTGSLFRTASANALCLTAVTGNITGFVTYAKY